MGTYQNQSTILIKDGDYMALIENFQGELAIEIYRQGFKKEADCQLIDGGKLPLKARAAGTPVISHASADDVRGKHVYGVLPMRLAAEAAMLTEVSMAVPAEWRGQELTLEQIKACSPTLATYIVKRQ